jgi:MFS family permease
VTESASTPSPVRLTFTHWLILILASIGFAFDVYEIVKAQFVVGPALAELGHFDATPEGQNALKFWRSILVYVPALAGGIFGLLGGYLTDILGRRRVLTGSMLLYAASALLSGYVTSLTALLILRSTTFVGVCVEFVAAVAWLAELFDNPHQRERVLGYTQAFSSFGGLLVAVAFGIAGEYSKSWPTLQLPAFLSSLGAIEDGTAPWRWTLISGVIPALPLLLIRPFLPESPKWQAKKETGTLKRPSIAAIFAPAYRRTTIVTTLMFACAYGAAFGAIQHIPEMVKGLADVKAMVAEKTAGISEKPKAAALERRLTSVVASEYGKMQEVGGLLGRFMLAFLAVRIVSRRRLLRVFQGPGLLVAPTVFYLFLTIDNHTFFNIPLKSVYLGEVPVSTVSLGVFFAGFFTVAQFSFWGNYLPRVYPVHLRGTGESFAANIGGRALGVGFWFVTNYLAGLYTEANTPIGALSYSKAAATTCLFVYAAGLILSFFLPEPTTQDLPD